MAVIDKTLENQGQSIPNNEIAYIEVKHDHPFINIAELLLKIQQQKYISFETHSWLKQYGIDLNDIELNNFTCVNKPLACVMQLNGQIYTGTNGLNTFQK